MKKSAPRIARAAFWKIRPVFHTAMRHSAEPTGRIIHNEEPKGIRRHAPFHQREIGRF